MIITTEALEAINKGFKSLFLEAYHGGTSPKVDVFAMLSTSSSEEEIYGWLGALPGLRELVDEIQIANLVEHAYGIKNKEWERTIAVKRTKIERDNLGVYSPLFTAMGLAARAHPDQLLADALLNGFDRKCYTGKNFFDSNHEPVKGKVKFSNVGTKKLSAANFETARENIKSRLNPEGEPMDLGLDLRLVVSPKNESLGRQIIIADSLAGGGTNVNKGTATLEVWPRLAADPEAWFLLDVGHPVKPFINQVEVETEFTSIDNPRDHHVFVKKEFLHQAYRRGNLGYGLPELAYGSDGTTAA